MKKQIFYQPAFWIVAALSVAAFDLAQVAAGMSWYRTKLAASQPAPPPPAPGSRIITSGPNVSYSSLLSSFLPAQSPPETKKTYSWQVAQPNSQVLQSTPPQVKIVPTEFSGNTGGWTMPYQGMAWGMRVAPQMILMSAYQFTNGYNRLVWQAPMPAGQYDFIANLPGGAMEALQAEAKKVLGVVAVRETREMDVLLLKVNHTNAPGLKPGVMTTGMQSYQNQPGITRFPNMPFSFVATYLESMLRIPVVDQTGLTGQYGIQFPNIRPTGAIFPGPDNGMLDQAKQVMLDQLGLDLIPSKAPIELLIVKKAE